MPLCRNWIAALWDLAVEYSADKRAELRYRLAAIEILSERDAVVRPWNFSGTRLKSTTSIVKRVAASSGSS